MCWQLTLSISQIVAACINRGVADNETSFAWRFPTAFQLVFPAIVYVAVWFVPESPRWLVSKGRMDKAKRSLERVNADNKTYDAEEDLNAMQMVIAQEAEDIATGSWSSLFQDPIERRKLLYSVGGIVSGQINGIQMVLLLRHGVCQSYRPRRPIPNDHHCLHYPTLRRRPRGCHDQPDTTQAAHADLYCHHDAINFHCWMYGHQ